MSQDYNATINLPKTDFPMRAGLPKREPEMLQRWKKLDVYGELLKKNAGQAPLLPPRRPSLLQRQPAYGPRPE